MEHENLLAKLRRILEEIGRIQKENPTGEDEPIDPRIIQLIDEGIKINNELDPLMRGTFRKDKATLAEWDGIYRVFNNWEKARTAEPDPAMTEFIDAAMEARKEVDPLIREAMKDNPEALAEWEEIMRMPYESKKEGLEEKKRLAEKNADKSDS